MDVPGYELEVEAATDLQSLWAICTRFCVSRGIRRVFYAHLPPVGAADGNRLRYATEGYSETLVDRYFATGIYRTSRNLKYANDHPQPFYWDEVPVLQDGQRHDSELDRILLESQMASGLCIPVFGPNSRNGLGSLEFPEGVTRLSREAVREFQWACQLAHLRYCELWEPELGPKPELSKREQEVLFWVARGKSNASIAGILGISAHTVDTHLRRIYLKLGVFDRLTAAVRGIGAGLIADSHTARVT